MVNLYQHSASTKLGSKLLSINDIYLPILFFDLSSEDSKYFQMFFGDDVDGIDYMKVIMDQVNSFYNSDDWLPKRLDKKLKSIKEYKDILNKDYNKYLDEVIRCHLWTIYSLFPDLTLLQQIHPPMEK